MSAIRIHFRSWVFLLVIFLITALKVEAQPLPRAKPEEVGLSSERLARIDRMMQRYVDENRLAGIVTLVARRGKIAHRSAIGKMSVETGESMKTDSLFRLYSMTKPITSVALLMLYEEGHFRLTDEVEKYIPAFKDMKVFDGLDSDGKIQLTNQIRKMNIQDIFRHTAGLEYGDAASPLAKAYQDAGIGEGMIKLKDLVEKLGTIPLGYQPGSKMVYSYAHDVQAYLVEHFSGMPYGEFLRERLFEPLGMNDTSFGLSEGKLKRYTTSYRAIGDERPISYELPTQGIEPVETPENSEYLQHEEFPGGGTGLISTAEDYFRFAQMLLNRGEFNGKRLLGSRTVDYMAMDNLPADMDRSQFIPGHGFGLGMAVLTDPQAFGSMGSAGEYWWWGAASTRVVIDPSEEMIIIFMTQLFPMNGPLVFQFEDMVFQSIID